MYSYYDISDDDVKMIYGYGTYLEIGFTISTTRYFKQTNMLGENQLKMYIVLIKY